MKDKSARLLIGRLLAERRSDAAFDELEAHFERLSDERPEDPALGEILSALADSAYAAGRTDLALRHFESRAAWCAARYGDSAPETMAAWFELGEHADEDFNFDVAMKAWSRIVATPLAPDAPSHDVRMRCDALRRLGARHLTDDPQAAHSLFEEELECREALEGADSPNLALSLHNLAAAADALGRTAEASRLRARQSAWAAKSGENGGRGKD